LKGVGAILINTANALIFDRLALRYHLKLNPDLAVNAAPFTLTEETYGFTLRMDDTLRTPLDISNPQTAAPGTGESDGWRIIGLETIFNEETVLRLMLGEEINMNWVSTQSFFHDETQIMGSLTKNKAAR